VGSRWTQVNTANLWCVQLQGKNSSEVCSFTTWSATEATCKDWKIISDHHIDSVFFFSSIELALLVSGNHCLKNGQQMVLLSILFLTGREPEDSWFKVSPCTTYDYGRTDADREMLQQVMKRVLTYLFLVTTQPLYQRSWRMTWFRRLCADPVIQCGERSIMPSNMPLLISYDFRQHSVTWLSFSHISSNLL